MRKIERVLRERIRALEETILEKDKELLVFRDHFAKRFKWWLQLLGEGKSPSIPWLIENDAKALHGLKSWWWG